MDADDLSARLERGDYGSLRHVSFTRHRVQEIDRLGPDAAFAVGLVYRDLGIPDAAEQLLRHAAADAPSPWREAAVEQLVRLLSDAERWPEIGTLTAAELDRANRDAAPDAVRAALAHARLEALYETDRFEELGQLDELFELVARAWSHADPRAREAALWRAVTLVELDRPGWPDAIRAVYRDYPAGDVHSRLWVYLINRDGLLAPFSEDERAFFRTRQLAAEGRPDEALTILIDLVSRRGGDIRELLAAPWTLHEISSAASRTGRTSAGARALEQIAVATAPPAARRALELAGRLYRQAGAWSAAVAPLEASLLLQEPGPDALRLRWYLLSVRVRRDPVGTARALRDEMAGLTNPSYFSDVLGELAGLLAERQDWDALQEAYDAIVSFAPPATLARYQIALARALETGRLSVPPARAEELRTRYLEQAAEQRGDLFAALLASTLLGRDGTRLLALEPEVSGRQTVDDQEHGAPGDEPDTAVLARTYLRYGLLDRLLQVVRADPTGIPAELRMRAAVRLADDGRIRESVLAMSALEASGAALTPDAARLRYPLAFAAVVDASAEAEGVDPAVLYALFREESLFDPEITSVVGAIGLAQLMPDTAADIARRMRMEDPVLTDPADNVAIGTRYFSMLTRQFGTVARAIAAYNGGQGNVRRWERRAPGMDEVLFHQTIPFPETYGHVRKVVVSAAYYGYLYANRPPAQTVRLVFDLD